MVINASRCFLLLFFPTIVSAQQHNDYYLEYGQAAESVVRKSDLLLQWSQELKASGLTLPRELYPAIVRARYSSISDELDGYAHELSLLQDSPQALGTTTLSPIEFHRVGEKVEITQTYTTGMPLPEGAGILVAKHWQHNIRLQAEDEYLPNYVSAMTDNPDVVLSMKRAGYKGVHGSPHGLVNLPLIEVVQGELQAGDKIVIKYGAGRDAFVLPEFPVARMTLPLYFRLSPSGHFYTIPVDSFSVIAGEPARVTVSAPSILSSGEQFSLIVRVEDSFGNLASGDTPSLDVNLDGVFRHRTEASADNVTVLEGLTFDSQGAHTITVRSGGGGLAGNSNPILVRDDSNLQIQWTDLHRHSNRSDGLQSPEEILAQSAGLLDLVLIADHDNYVLFDDHRQAREVSLPLARGGHRLNVSGELPGQPPVVIALPEMPTDHRKVKPGLVEIRSGSSSHEWFGRHFADMGYRIGFTGSQTSHLPGNNMNLSKTAIMITGQESWYQALNAGRTFVTTGAKSILLTRVNGAMPGSRVAHSARRQINGEILASSAIDAIELLRNGLVVDHFRFEDTQGALQVKVTLGSDSKPLVPGWDTPRNARQWLGFLRVRGAHISSLDAPGIGMKSRSAIAINPTEPERVDFVTWTHGTESSFVLSLDEIPGEEILFEISVKEGFEDVDLLPSTREPALTPGLKYLLSLNDIGGGSITRAINVGGYSDFIRFELTNTHRSRHLSFSFVDTREAGIGDYYYIRVRQTDDHMLWSSPVYVGGYDGQ